MERRAFLALIASAPIAALAPLPTILEQGVRFNGKLFLAFDSTQGRLRVWNPTRLTACSHWRRVRNGAKAVTAPSARQVTTGRLALSRPRCRASRYIPL